MCNEAAKKWHILAGSAENGLVDVVLQTRSAVKSKKADLEVVRALKTVS
jgi:hypothetical protein